MIRVPLASASAGVIGLAGMPYRVRRGLVPVMPPSQGVLAPSSVATESVAAPAVTETASPSHAVLPAAEPSFRAPWGDLERELPYVTITTQPWPEEWWRPSARRVAAATVGVATTAIARATDTPAERVNLSAVAVPVDSAHPIAITPIAIKPMVEPEPFRETPASAATPNRDARRAARNQAPRRGFLGRLALVAAGLVLSLIAVESASRRRH